ncbi:MAG: N-methylhydantoinase B/oxoprolinase/acetone carboxylase alpha subunit, partial [Ilumatobacter sp.]
AVDTQARLNLTGTDVIRLELPGGGGYGAAE